MECLTLAFAGTSLDAPARKWVIQIIFFLIKITLYTFAVYLIAFFLTPSLVVQIDVVGFIPTLVEI